MMKSYITLLAVLMLCVIKARISSSSEFTISPTCFSQSCYTINTIRPTTTNITLNFLAGVHKISSVVSIQRKKYVEFRVNSGQATIACMPRRYGANIRISDVSKIQISGLTFSGCNIEFIRTNDTAIDESNFIDGANGAFEFSNSYNVTIDKSSFNNNSDSAFGGVLEFSNTKGVEITRSNFYNNHVSSFAGVITFSTSSGFIGCTTFHSSSADSFGAIVNLESGSGLYVSNSSFKNNSASSFGGIINLDSSNDNVVVINSVFTDSSVGYRDGVINVDAGKASATIIASKFINTTSIYSSFGHSVYSYNSKSVIVDCSDFVNSIILTQFLQNNTGLCEGHDLEDSATCEDMTCNLKDCRPLTVEVSLEQSEYTVNEGIGKANRALQICAVTMDLLFGVQVSLDVQNGSATEIGDFIIDTPECLLFKFTRKAGIQKECAFIRIVEDSIKEGNEQFSVSLSSFNSQVVFGTEKATITIVEEDAPIPATKAPITGPSKTAVVECGPLRRPITYSGGGNDLNSLQTAIIQSFEGLTGIRSSHIALLQIKSDTHADYIDALSSSMVVDDNSLVRVITYDGFSCQPRAL